MYFDSNEVHVHCGSLYINCRILLNYECYEPLDIVFFFHAIHCVNTFYDLHNAIKVNLKYFGIAIFVTDNFITFYLPESKIRRIDLLYFLKITRKIRQGYLQSSL